MIIDLYYKDYSTTERIEVLEVVEKQNEYVLIYESNDENILKEYIGKDWGEIKIVKK